MAAGWLGFLAIKGTLRFNHEILAKVVSYHSYCVCANNKAKLNTIDKLVLIWLF